MEDHENWADEVPVLEHWAAFREVARVLGISRQQVHIFAQQGKFKTLRKLDTEGRPAFVIKRSELNSFAETYVSKVAAKRGFK